MEFALRLGSHSDARRVPNAVLGTIIFVAAEVMFFAALISAHTIARASAMGGYMASARATAPASGPNSDQYRCPAGKRRAAMAGESISSSGAKNRAALPRSGASCWAPLSFLCKGSSGFG